MWYRLAAVAGLVFAVAGLGSAQPGSTYSKAVPPDKAVLDRLNLRTLWKVVVPVEGNRDTLEQVQALDDQVFVQTRTGLIVAIDALTGRTQWTARVGNGGPANVYPAAANANFVFCAHVTKLYAFHRYTGVAEFVAELGTPPSAGLAADDSGVVCMLGSNRVAIINMLIGVKKELRPALLPAPPSVTPRPPETVPALLLPPPPTAVGGGYGGTNTSPSLSTLPSVTPPYSLGNRAPSPSLSTLPSVTPPYSLGNRAPSPSLSLLPSLRQPYQLRLDSERYVQRTPSLGRSTSVVDVLKASDLRPRPDEPDVRWEYGFASRVLYPAVLTPTRVWAVTADNTVLALNKLDKKVEASERLISPVVAMPAGSGTTHFIPLGNGTLLSVDANSTNLSGGLAIKWRVDTGGLNNHTPFVTKTHVYAAGDNTGVACFERDTGDLIWKSDNSADSVIAANEEFVYLRDRQGRFLVYDARRATDRARTKSVPLGSANFADFDVSVVNSASDRVFLAANNGLIVCLRDAAEKYARPVRIWPPPDVNSKVIGADVPPKKDDMPTDPKKDPEPPKKEPDPPKKDPVPPKK